MQQSFILIHKSICDRPTCRRGLGVQLFCYRALLYTFVTETASWTWVLLPLGPSCKRHLILKTTPQKTLDTQPHIRCVRLHKGLNQALFPIFLCSITHYNYLCFIWNTAQCRKRNTFQPFWRNISLSAPVHTEILAIKTRYYVAVNLLYHLDPKNFTYVLELPSHFNLHRPEMDKILGLHFWLKIEKLN